MEVSPLLAVLPGRHRGRRPHDRAAGRAGGRPAARDRAAHEQVAELELGRRSAHATARSRRGRRADGAASPGRARRGRPKPTRRWSGDAARDRARDLRLPGAGRRARCAAHGAPARARRRSRPGEALRYRNLKTPPARAGRSRRGSRRRDGAGRQPRRRGAARARRDARAGTSRRTRTALHRPPSHGQPATRSSSSRRCAPSGRRLPRGPATASWWLEHYAEFGAPPARALRAARRGEGTGQLFRLEGGYGLDAALPDDASEGPLRPAQPPRRLSRAGRRRTRCGCSTRCGESDEFEPLVLARAPGGAVGPQRRQTRSRPSAGEPGQYPARTRRGAYDKFFMTCRDKSPVHRQHLAGVPARRIGPTSCTSSTRCSSATTIVDAARRVLAATPRSSTRCTSTCRSATTTARWCAQARRELCLEASPRRCHECYPGHPAAEFFLRKRFIQSHLSAGRPVHRAQPLPARALRRLGHSTGADRHEDHGFFPVVPSDRSRAAASATASRFFGVLTPFKGIDVLLRAMALLGPDFGGPPVDSRRQLRGRSDDEVQAELGRPARGHARRRSRSPARTTTPTSRG